MYVHYEFGNLALKGDDNGKLNMISAQVVTPNQEARGASAKNGVR